MYMLHGIQTDIHSRVHPHAEITHLNMKGVEKKT